MVDVPAAAVDVTEELAIFTDHDWYSVVGYSSDSLSVVVNVGNRTKEVGRIMVKDGKISSECNKNWDDGKPNPFRDMQVKKLEKRQLCIELGEFRTTYLAPTVNYNDVHRTSILSCDVNSSGSLVVSASSDGSIKIWNPENGELIKKFDGENLDVNKVRFFPSGLVVLSCGEDLSVRVLSAETGICYRTFHGHQRGVRDIGFIGVGKEVLSVSMDGTVKVWNCGTAKCLHSFQLNQRGLNAMDVCGVANSESVFCGVAGEDGASLLDLRCSDAMPLVSTKVDQFTAITFDGENKLYLGSEKGAILNYDLRNRQLLSRMQTYRSDITHFSKISNNMLFTSFRDGSVCAYEKGLKQRAAVLCFSGADCDPVYDFSIYNNTTLYSCCRDRVIRRYEIVV